MSRKGENIYKRKDGRWEGRYIKSRTCTGKIVYGYVYAKTYREVKAKLREKALSYNAQPVVSVAASSALFSEIASDWFANIGLQTKESTRNKYHNILCDYILPEYSRSWASGSSPSMMALTVPGRRISTAWILPSRR